MTPQTEKERAKQLIGEISAFTVRPGECKKEKIVELANLLGYQGLILVKVGGEGIIIKAKENSTKKLVCLKIARNNLQDLPPPSRDVVPEKKTTSFLDFLRGGKAEEEEDKEKTAEPVIEPSIEPATEPAKVVVKPGEGKILARVPTPAKGLKIPKNTGRITIAKKEIPRNRARERFLSGCQAQRELASYLRAFHQSGLEIPGVLKISEDPVLHCVMDWLEGKPILEWLSQKNDIVYSVKIFLQLLKSIEYVHNKGYINRDIKSSNLLIYGNLADSIAWVDWTMAKSPKNRDITLDGTQGGTGGYAPIKFISGRKFGEANELDDLYMAGMALWEFVIQAPIPKVFDTEYNEKKNLAYRREILGYLPECIQPVFWKATEIKEQDRFQSAVDFQRSIARILNYLEEEQNKTLYNPSNLVIPDLVETIVDDETSWGDYVKNPLYREIIVKMIESEEKLYEYLNQKNRNSRFV